MVNEISRSQDITGSNVHFTDDTPEKLASASCQRSGLRKDVPMSGQRSPGAMRGRRQRRNSVPRSVARARPGKLIATGMRLELTEYLKAHTAAEAAGPSLSGYVAELARRDQVDEHGRPLWADPAPEQLVGCPSRMMTTTTYVPRRSESPNA